ncbi:MAG: class I SAM-dependent methyltransferase [Aliidiomarina sp.]|uniref:class I SAM-dependent methyltransferase n=1 Tax=Aliidiomarina sp. TaxID=1872439 RepID=UPI0025C585ED|nr:class I SAM-dependent methyltransferase [Aliidiomarina sp.]MCH8501358.1 class I SAM-dependent methyltransferase [Aliidiomarina sp.]
MTAIAHTQLLMRQLDVLPSGKLLLVHPPAQQATTLQQSGFTTLSWHLHASDAYQGGSDDILAPFLAEPLAVDAVVVNVPKEKQLVHMLMANLAAVLPVQTPIFLIGHKDSGIQSYIKSPFVGYSANEKLASGNHCQLLRCELKTAISFNPDTYLSSYPLPADFGGMTIFNYPGVFSQNRLDGGSDLLLRTLYQQPVTACSGDLLDFACGAGVIAAALQHRVVAKSITGIDINTLALAAAEKTLAPLAEHVTLLASDGLAVLKQQTTVKYDCIVTNPPFHAGRQTDYAITQNFIRQCRQYLKPGGKLFLVGNSFLPYRDVLATTFKQVHVLADNRKFTVWAAS